MNGCQVIRLEWLPAQWRGLLAQQPLGHSQNLPPRQCYQIHTYIIWDSEHLWVPLSRPPSPLTHSYSSHT
jgi:hypothetical protein